MILAWFGLPQLVPHQFTVAGDTHVVYNPVVLASVEKDLPAESAIIPITIPHTKFIYPPNRRDRFAYSFSIAVTSRFVMSGQAFLIKISSL
ncbi:hypothetical protein G112A_00052 [Candidatus Nanosynsacchari sp. TM7_G1_3_12Alb]|nr:hypothetical protein G112A_00052 [Candidatus Nanosynsacchari sp. TM7_G1_3_12Alb]